MWGLMADESRRRVFAALVLGARSISDVSTATAIPTRQVVRALARLEAGGVVSGCGDDWLLREDVIDERARSEASPLPAYALDGIGPREASVLRSFLREGRLVSIPAVRSKRLVVLDHIARVFDIGMRYPESEVNVLLRLFHPDHAALRRDLVDEGFLSREAGVYWRSGGTVPV